MFKEKELISQIKQLKIIKPRQDWVVFNKEQILGIDKVNQEKIQETFSFREIFSNFFFKPALAGVAICGLLIAAFVISQEALPGDLLYSFKKVTEQGQQVFVSEKQMPKYNLAIANKRLEELTKIAEIKEAEGNGKQDKKLSLAVTAFQEEIAEAVESLAKIETISAESNDSVIIENIVEQTKKLEENKQKAEKLGIEIGGTEELDNVLAELIQREIQALEENTLTEEQTEILDEIKQDYEQGDYSFALEKILIMSYPQINEEIINEEEQE